MNESLVLLTPLLVLLMLILFGFSGCTPFGDEEVTGTLKNPPLSAATSYAKLVLDTPGFAAHWPLDEVQGTVATVVGALNPAAIGQYVDGGPPGTGLKLGETGVRAKEAELGNNFAPRFLGTTGFVEVAFNALLNPLSNVPGFSIELWLKPDPGAGPATQVVISSHRVDARQGYEIALIKIANEPHQLVRCRMFSGEVANVAEVTVQPSVGLPNEWRYVVLVYEGGATGGRLTLHVRILNATTPFQDGPRPSKYLSVNQASPATLRFGAGHGSSQFAVNGFAGLIDEVAFYHGALSQADMDKHFNGV